MSMNETEHRVDEAPEDQPVQELLNDDVPDQKSGVGLSKEIVMAKAKYKKGDMVHMAMIANGQRTKGVYTIQAAVYNPKGWVDYQLADYFTGETYRHGAGVREKELKPGA